MNNVLEVEHNSSPFLWRALPNSYTVARGRDFELLARIEVTTLAFSSSYFNCGIVWSSKQSLP
jgi:hypothetical protein